MSKYWRKKTVLVKLEASYGVDPTPTGAANAVLTTDFKIMPMEGNDVSRDIEQPYLGAQGTLPVELHTKITFNVELEPSGIAGTAPAWASLLRMCAVAQTISVGNSVTFNPISNNHESGTLWFGLDGTKYVSNGMRGDCTLDFTAQGIPYLRFAFTGLFTQPSEGSVPAPILTAYKKPQVVTNSNTTFSLGGAALVLRKLSLAFGNDVQPNFLVGEELIDITDKAETVDFTVKAVPLTTFNPYAAALSDADLPLILVHGKTAGRIATLNMPKIEIQRPQGLEDVQGKVEWPLKAQPLPTVGNDQWTLTLT